MVTPRLQIRSGPAGAAVVESTADPLQSMRKVVQSLDGQLPLSQPFVLSDAIEQQVWLLRVFGRVFLTFAFIAMLMASIGIYAVVAQATGRRTQEIGVRIALGATVRSILLLVMKRGLWQIGVGLAVGMAAAFPLARLLASMPQGALHSDPAVVMTVTAGLALVGAFACWLPARRAASLDPVKAIRCE